MHLLAALLARKAQPTCCRRWLEERAAPPPRLFINRKNINIYIYKISFGVHVTPFQRLLFSFPAVEHPSQSLPCNYTTITAKYFSLCNQIVYPPPAALTPVFAPDLPVIPAWLQQCLINHHLTVTVSCSCMLIWFLLPWNIQLNVSFEAV